MAKYELKNDYGTTLSTHRLLRCAVEADAKIQRATVRRNGRGAWYPTTICRADSEPLTEEEENDLAYYRNGGD